MNELNKIDKIISNLAESFSILVKDIEREKYI